MQEVANARTSWSNGGSVASNTQAIVLSKRWAETWRRRLVTLTLVSSDTVLALCIWQVAIVLQVLWGQGELTDLALATVVSNVAIWIGLRGLFGLYPGYGMDQTEELRRQTHAVLLTLAITASFAVAFQVGDKISRLLLVLGFLGLAVLAPIVRHLFKRAMERTGVWGKPVAILNFGDTKDRLPNALLREWSLGLKPIAVFEGLSSSREETDAGSRDEEIPPAAMELATRDQLDTIVLNAPNAQVDRLGALCDQASARFRHVIILPAGMVGVTNSAAVVRNFAGTFGAEVHYNLLNPWIRRAKRVLDLSGVVFGGLLISPLLLGLALLIKLDSPGPVFYGSLRRGLGGRQFRCWKFRTMHQDAERLLHDCFRQNPHLKIEWERNYKLQKDPRVTRVGHLLRKTSLDELPQLWNVLLGEMSLVGPRPMLEAELANYGKTYELYKRVPPGITGLWQVSGRSDVSYAERLMMNAFYVRDWSIWLDLVILARTLSVVLLRRGAR